MGTNHECPSCGYDGYAWRNGTDGWVDATSSAAKELGPCCGKCGEEVLAFQCVTCQKWLSGDYATIPGSNDDAECDRCAKKRAVALARNLTRAERRALVLIVENECCWHAGWAPGQPRATNRMFWIGGAGKEHRAQAKTIHSLEKRGLLEEDPRNFSSDICYEPTLLGRLVAKHLGRTT